MFCQPELRFIIPWLTQLTLGWRTNGQVIMCHCLAFLCSHTHLHVKIEHQRWLLLFATTCINNSKFIHSPSVDLSAGSNHTINPTDFKVNTSACHSTKRLHENVLSLLGSLGSACIRSTFMEWGSTHTAQRHQHLHNTSTYTYSQN